MSEPIVAPPAAGAPPLRVADGLLWMRLALPFALNHVNVFVLRDGDGWLAVDAGIDNADTRQSWETLFAAIGGREKLKRLLVTHHHVDHVGSAACVARETGCEVLMSAPEAAELRRSLTPHAGDREQRLVAHFHRLGCDPKEAAELAAHRWRTTSYVGGYPERVRLLEAGETVTIDGRPYAVRLGGGHTVASVMLAAQDRSILIAGDQILHHISPFVGVLLDAPEANPLADYLRFLADVGPTIAPETLVLPGHGVLFRDGKARCDALAAHHAERCERILRNCREEARSVRGLIEAVFTRNLDGVMGMALAEIHAHVNLMLADGRLTAAERDGQLVYRAV